MRRTRREHDARLAENSPQGLKPEIFRDVCDTAKAVPFQSMVYAASFRLLCSVWVVLVIAGFAAPSWSQGAPPQTGAGQPYTVEYYYKCQWGHQAEFLQLFLKNHYPLLQKIVGTGRMLSVKIESPAYHTTEDGRWDYRVTIRFKDSTAATTSNPDEEAFIKQLWPDQATYQKEEQRRFEILLAHWDLPVTEITPKR